MACRSLIGRSPFCTTASDGTRMAEAARRVVVTPSSSPRKGDAELIEAAGRVGAFELAANRSAPD